MPHIHPSSVIDPGAQIADDVVIGPLCYVGSKVTVGPGCRLVAQVSVLGRTTLGSGNTIWPQAVLGADPQDLKFRGEDTQLIIGDRNEIRELVTAHLGTANGGGITRIGSDNLIMGGVHIAHDCEIGSHVILANNVGLAGHVKVEDHANLGGAVGVHHFVTFGQYCFVGGMSRIVHDVPPFHIVEGNPSSVRGINFVGLGRSGFPPETIDRLRDCFRRIYRAKGSAASETDRSDGATLLQRLETVAAEHAGDSQVAILIQSLRQSARSPNCRYRETLRTDNRRENPTA